MKVKVKIIAEVTTEVEVDHMNEVFGLTVDIYSFNKHPIDKVDHGADAWTIEVLEDKAKKV